MARGGSSRCDDVVAVIDLGSACMRGALARWRDAGQPEVLALARCPSRGIEAGELIAPAAAMSRVQALMDDLILQAGAPPRQAIFTYGGAGLASLRLIGRVRVGGTVRDSHMRAATAAVRRSRLPDGYSLLHAPVLGYAIDDVGGAQDPRGLRADTLAVLVHGVAAPLRVQRDLTDLAGAAGLRLAAVIAQPVAAAEVLVGPDARREGVLLVECGAGVTRAAVVLEAGVAHVACVPVGGANVTADLAAGLGLDLPGAEAWKRHASPYAAAIRTIACPRVEETFKRLREALAASDAQRLGARRVVLTGEAARLPGLRDVAEAVFKLPVQAAGEEAGDAVMLGALHFLEPIAGAAATPGPSGAWPARLWPDGRRLVGRGRMSA
jgi:cell division protein FtsA